MSKQSDAKKSQDYNPKPATKTCANCRHLEFTSRLPEWMAEANDRRICMGSTLMYGPEYELQKDLRCAIGGFAVKKMATCKEFERKKNE